MKDTVLLIITDGRWDCFQRTVESFWANTNGAKLDVVIVDDSADNSYTRRVMQFCPYATVIFAPQRRGFTGAIRAGWDYILEHEYNFVFHLEDDFEFQRSIDLLHIRTLLENNHNIKQIALKRDIVNSDEQAHGGFMYQYPDLYTDEVIDGQPLVTTRRNFTTNPCMYRTAIMQNGWPDCKGSEGEFGDSITRVDSNALFAFMGTISDKPWVKHTGDIRVGNGY